MKTCCGYSLEELNWDTVNEYPQHIFLLRNKKNTYQDTSHTRIRISKHMKPRLLPFTSPLACSRHNWQTINKQYISYLSQKTLHDTSFKPSVKHNEFTGKNKKNCYKRFSVNISNSACLWFSVCKSNIKPHYIACFWIYPVLYGNTGWLKLLIKFTNLFHLLIEYSEINIP